MAEFLSYVAVPRSAARRRGRPAARRPRAADATLREPGRSRPATAVLAGLRRADRDAHRVGLAHGRPHRPVGRTPDGGGGAPPDVVGPAPVDAGPLGRDALLHDPTRPRTRRPGPTMVTVGRAARRQQAGRCCRCSRCLALVALAGGPLLLWIEPDRTGAAVAAAVTAPPSRRPRSSGRRDGAPAPAARAERDAAAAPRAAAVPGEHGRGRRLGPHGGHRAGGAFGLYLFVGSGIAADRDQDVMYDELKEQLGQATVPVDGAIPTGTPIGIVEIPRLGLEQVFVEGSASEQTIERAGAAARLRAARAGRCLGAGRAPRHVRGGVRRPRPARGRRPDRGDHRPGRVHLRRRPGAHQRRARRQIEQVPARLTLVTSDPAITPSRSLQVSAQLDGEAAARHDPAGDRRRRPPGEGSSGRQVVAAPAGRSAARRHRRSPPGRRCASPAAAVWIGAVPVLLALLWKVFENLAVLLPNTL